MQRNFRSTYLKTLGIRGVQVKVPVESVLREDVIDTDKLAKLCTNYGIPAVHRIDVWKLLLGVVPRYREGWGFVSSQRSEQYDLMHQFVCTLTGKPQHCDVTPRHLVMMCLVTVRVDIHQAMAGEHDSSTEHMRSVASVFLDVCYEVVDAYWLTLRLLTCTNLCAPLGINLAQDEQRFQPLIAALTRLVIREDRELSSHLHGLQVQYQAFAVRWFRSHFAESVPVAGIERVWDRIIGGLAGGQPLITVCIAVAILLTFRATLLAKRSANDIVSFLTKLPDGQTDRILEMGLQLYEKHSDAKGGDNFSDLSYRQHF